jgi:carbamoyl-phosphate synthase large subunit
MKSVGEVMAIGRTFKEALMKAVRSLETGKKGPPTTIEPRRLRQKLVTPIPERLAYLRYAFDNGHERARCGAVYRDGPLVSAPDEADRR